MVAPCQEISKKYVSFFPTGRLRTVKHINDYTHVEFEETWYSQTDLLDIIIKECQETVSMMAKEEVLLAPEDGFCKRGLEYQTSPKGSKFQKGYKICAMQKVMEEQNLQKSMGIVDAEYLAELYIDATKTSERLALMMGLRDYGDKASHVGPFTAELLNIKANNGYREQIFLVFLSLEIPRLIVWLPHQESVTFQMSFAGLTVIEADATRSCRRFQ
jgi:hypothetical protein